MEHLSCKQFVDFLDDYIAGEQPEEVRRAFEEHVCNCAPCVEFLESYKQTIETSRKACCCGREEIPKDEVPQGLIDAILNARKAGGSS